MSESSPPIRTSVKGHRSRPVPIEVQFLDLVALFDKTIASITKVSAESDNLSDQAIASELDDSLLELRIWMEDIKHVIPNANHSSSGFEMIDKLEGPAASTLRSILSNLQADITDLSTTSDDTGLYDLGHQSRYLV